MRESPLLLEAPAKPSEAPEPLATSLVFLGPPAFLLLFGYLLFYLQLLVQWWQPSGPGQTALSVITALLLAGSFCAAAWLFGRLARSTLQELAEGSWLSRVALGAIALVALLLAIAALLSLKPAHLVQEGDFPNYHLTIPRQSWLWADWGTSGYLPMRFILLLQQFGLSYLWLGSPAINRFPAFLHDAFLLLTIWSFFRVLRVPRPYASGLLAVAAFLAFRGVAIQLGTAMLDLPATYYLASLALLLCFFATSEVSSRGRSLRLLSFLLGTDLAAYLGYKSFSIAFLAAMALALEVALRRFHGTSLHAAVRNVRLRWMALPLLLMFVPNAIRSILLTGDPLYPVLPWATRLFCERSWFGAQSCAAFAENTEYVRNVLEHYGYGHGPISFVRAFLMVPLAAPGTVNNAFDYPLGAFWYVAWAAPIAAIVRGAPPLRKSGWLTLLLAGGIFCTWFAGSQQSRWLYPALLVLSGFWGLLAGSLLEAKSAAGRLVRLGVAASLVCASANGARMVRAQRTTLRCWGQSCLATHARYEADDQRDCADEPVDVSDQPNERGYLKCKMEGRIDARLFR